MLADRKRELSRFGRLGRWIGLTIGVFGLAAVAGEVLLRIDPALCPPQQQLKLAEAAGLHSYVDDPDLGARPTPLFRDTIRTQDYSYLVQLDSLGFPNAMPWPAQPEVAVLGNSLIVGAGVGMQGQFTTLLSRSLGGRPVLNLGLPGGSPQQELRIYSKYARPRHPKFVIATLWVASDIDNNVQFKHWLDEGSPADFTGYRMSYGSTHSKRPLMATVRDYASHSYLLRAMFYAADAYERPKNVKERITFNDGESIFLSVRAQYWLALGAKRPGFDLKTDFIAPLEKLRAAADSDGARFVVVLLPSKEELYAAESFPDVLSTIRDVRAGLASANLPVLDLYDVFRERDKERPMFYKRDIHFNALGNELVAKALEGWIAGGGVTSLDANRP